MSTVAAESKPLDAYYTPDWLATEMVSMACLPNLPETRVLEPSAGNGVIVHTVRRLASQVHVTAVEPNGKARDGMLSRVLPQEVSPLSFESFVKGLDLRSRYDVAIMNPPYSRDCVHLELAMSVAKEVVALLRVNALTGKERKARVWDHAEVLELAFISGRPTFSGPSDKGMKARHDFVVVRFREKRNAHLHRGGDCPSVRWI